MTMRFGVCVPQSGRFLDMSVQQHLATEIESMGYDSIWTSDHVIVPAGESYIPEAMHEPLALLSWLAATTSRITLGISVLVIPYRDPVFTAKFLSSVDVLSGGRVVLGAGAGWLRQEFDALSASYEERGAQTDEYLRVIRNLWETETSSFDGRWKHYADMRMFPKGDRSRPRGVGWPHGHGTIPIVVGGNASPSIRRAAELGDGWHPINLTPDQLRDGVAQYHAACERFGRSPGQVILRHMPGGRTPTDGELSADDLRAYEEAGLDELLLSYAAPSVEDLLDRFKRFPR
jgi:probable F420-dependent oxidoreductase